MLMNHQKKPQELYLFLGSKGLQSIQRRIAGSFGNLAMETAETKSLHSLIVGIESMSSLTFCSRWILGHETHQSLHPVRKVASK